MTTKFLLKAFTDQIRARTTLWSGSNENVDNLESIKNPVLVTAARHDVIDLPKNAPLIKGQIPWSRLASFDGGQPFAATVDAFLMQQVRSGGDDLHPLAAPSRLD